MSYQEKDCEENVENVARARNVGNTRSVANARKVANVTNITDFWNFANAGNIEQLVQNFTLPILANKSVNILRLSNLARNPKIPGIIEVYTNPNSVPDLAKASYLKMLKFLKNQKKVDSKVEQNIQNKCINDSDVIIIKKPIINIEVEERELAINFDELLTKTFFEQGCLNGFEVKHIVDRNKIHGINIYLHYDFFKTLFLFKKNLSASEIKSLKNIKIKLISKSILKRHLAKSNANKNFRNHKNFKFLNNNNNRNRNKENDSKFETEIVHERKSSTVIRFKNRTTLFEYNPNENVMTGMETLEKINKIFEIKSSLKITTNKNQLTEKSGAISCDNVDTEEFIKSYQLYELRKCQNLNSIAELRLRQLEKYYNTYRHI